MRREYIVGGIKSSHLSCFLIVGTLFNGWNFDRKFFSNEIDVPLHHYSFLAENVVWFWFIR
jgi:hypothetical protein